MNIRAASGSMDIITFYTSNSISETGLTNPLEDQVIAIKEQYDITLADLLSKYNDSGGACYQEAAMGETIRLIGVSESMIDAISCSVSFDAIAPELNTAFTEFCSGFFTGIFFDI